MNDIHILIRNRRTLVAKIVSEVGVMHPTCRNIRKNTLALARAGKLGFSQGFSKHLRAFQCTWEHLRSVNR